jgi:hypothetical protein
MLASRQIDLQLAAIEFSRWHTCNLVPLNATAPSRSRSSQTQHPRRHPVPSNATRGYATDASRERRGEPQAQHQDYTTAERCPPSPLDRLQTRRTQSETHSDGLRSVWDSLLCVTPPPAKARRLLSLTPPDDNELPVRWLATVAQERPASRRGHSPDEPRRLADLQRQKAASNSPR